MTTGYTLRDLSNNLEVHGSEYETFIGTRIMQPLLKNFGPGPTMARIRLAALASDIAFQEYRRQLMLTLGQAESGYWDLHLLQEQERLSRESVATAEKILADNRARVEVGKGSELEVLEAQAGLATRRTRLNEALQRRYEGGTRLSTFYSFAPRGADRLPRAVDTPTVSADTNSLAASYALAFQQNPDYLIRRTQATQENVRLAYAKNQRLPELDLKASFGRNGLGHSAFDSWDSVTLTNFTTWEVGFELRVPLAGDIKARNEYQAAKLNKERILVGIKETEVQLLNSLDAAQHKVGLYMDSIPNERAVVDFHEKLLQAQLDRLAVGGTDSKTVLETEARLFEAKVTAVENLVTYRKALLELELVRGTLLSARGLEVTRAALKAKTEDYLHHTRLSSATIDAAARRALADVNQATSAAN